MSLCVFGDCLPAYDMNNEIRLDSLACGPLGTIGSTMARQSSPTRGRHVYAELLQFTGTQCKRKLFKATPRSIHAIWKHHHLSSL